jgi:FkbM family methyltransferase
VDPAWLLRNIETSWRHGARPSDFTRQLLLRYSSTVPSRLRRSQWAIGLRYPPPIGSLRLLLRDNGGSDLFVYSEVFEHEYYRLPLTHAPATVLDLGSNIGLTAVYFSRVFPDAHLACVEPVADNLRILRQNLKMNGVEAAVFPAAVHVTDGIVAMERAGMAYAHKVSAGPQPASAEPFEVAALTIPSMLQRLGWARIGLLKIDIEGHEKQLFSAPCEWLDLVDAMCVEWHDEGGERELARIAADFSFRPPRQLPGALWFLTR